MKEMLNRRDLVLATICLLTVGRPAMAATYKVSYVVKPIKQPSSMSCWAAAATMIYNWKFGIDQDIEAVVSLAGAKYVTIYKESFPPKSRGISASEEADFYNALPMSVIKGLSPSIKGWHDILASKGPLSITVDAQPGTGTIHALVVTGIDGDGTSGGTIVTYIDPGDGQSHSVTV